MELSTTMAARRIEVAQLSKNLTACILQEQHPTDQEQLDVLNAHGSDLASLVEAG